MKTIFRAQHYFLFIAAVIGAVWFFIGYPEQDVRSAIDISFQTEEIKTRAVSQFTSLGYSLSDYRFTDVSLLKIKGLVDSLQDDLGRPQAVEVLENNAAANIKPYFWQITFTNQESPSRTPSDKTFYDCVAGEICLRLDMKGRFMALLNPSNAVPAKEVQRKAVSAVFGSYTDSLKKPFFTTLADSLLTTLLYFNIDEPESNNSITADLVRERLLAGLPYRYSKNDAVALAHYYMELTGWEASSLSVDTVTVKRSDAANAVHVSYVLEEPLLGQQMNLSFLITPAGALLHLRAEYNKSAGEINSFGSDIIWAFVKQILILIFILIVCVIFFFRMRARAIDTRPAVIAAIIIGFIVAVYTILWTIGPQGLLKSSYGATVNVITLAVMGVISAAACVSAFILSAVGDSVIRQFWYKKLACYDYLRQGMVFNKPIGTILLKSAAIAFALAGYWTLLLYLFPGLYFSNEMIFIAQEAAWPVLRMLTHNAWLSFFTVLSIFLVIAGRIYGWRQNKWFVAVPVILACGVVMAPLFSYGPAGLEIAVGALLGLAFYLIYLNSDFLTLILSHFLFLCLVGSAGGWIINNSPDLFVFVWTLILFTVVVAAGVFAVYFGEDERRLTSYVPGYIEEHANEERIKQELEIARDVQQSFLPKKNPDIKELDIAAVCKPAYETGGDYYDFIRLDDRRIAVAIGDVSGKGIQSAFYMTFIKGLLHSLSRETISPAKVLKRANRFFYENADKSTFISLVYGVIDLQKRTFTFARAGHNPVLHLNISNSNVRELRPNGMGIGLTKEKIFDNKINEIELSITKDDLFLLYTDGITEALNESRQFYGSESLRKIIREHKNETASVLINIISNEMNAFIGQARQHDDMTIMVIRLAQTLDNE